MGLKVRSWNCFSQVISGVRGPFVHLIKHPVSNKTESWRGESAPVCLELGENKMERIMAKN